MNIYTSYKLSWIYSILYQFTDGHVNSRFGPRSKRIRSLLSEPLFYRLRDNYTIWRTTFQFQVYPDSYLSDPQFQIINIAHLQEKENYVQTSDNRNQTSNHWSKAQTWFSMKFNDTLLFRKDFSTSLVIMGIQYQSWDQEIFWMNQLVLWNSWHRGKRDQFYKDTIPCFLLNIFLQ